jgi:hypothetical protein
VDGRIIQEFVVEMWKSVDLNRVAQDRDQRRALVNAVTNLRFS